MDVFTLRRLVNVPEAPGALRHFRGALSPALRLWKLRAEKDEQVPTDVTLELPPELFGTSDGFHGRQLFLRPKLGVGFRDDSSAFTMHFVSIIISSAPQITRH